jgi:hypothetical protein
MLGGLIVTIWTAVLLVVLFIEHAVGSLSLSHFTHWSWLMQIAFYAPLTFSYWFGHAQLYEMLIRVGLFVVHGVAWIVFAISTALFTVTNMQMLVTPSADWSLGMAYLTNTVIHMAPALVCDIYALRAWPLLSRVFGDSHRSANFVSRFWLIFVYVAYPLWPLIIYMLAFDPRKEYDTGMANMWTLLFASITTVVANGSLYYALVSKE